MISDEQEYKTEKYSRTLSICGMAFFAAASAKQHFLPVATDTIELSRYHLQFFMDNPLVYGTVAIAACASLALYNHTRIKAYELKNNPPKPSL